MCEFLLSRRFLPTFFCFGFLCFFGCATETVKPTFSTASGLRQPDRVLVYEFAVAAPDLGRGGIVGSGLDRSAAQSEEDLRAGRALAKAISDNLVSELRRLNINTSAATQAVAPGATTASIRGQFQSADPGQESSMGFTLGGKELRTRIQIFQGIGTDLRMVAESEYTMPSQLRLGLAAETLASAIKTDAARVAQALADRVADYYRKQGWLK